MGIPVVLSGPLFNLPLTLVKPTCYVGKWRANWSPWTAQANPNHFWGSKEKVFQSWWLKNVCLCTHRLAAHLLLLTGLKPKTVSWEMPITWDCPTNNIWINSGLATKVLDALPTQTWELCEIYTSFLSGLRDLHKLWNGNGERPGEQPRSWPWGRGNCLKPHRKYTLPLGCRAWQREQRWAARVCALSSTVCAFQPRVREPTRWGWPHSPSKSHSQQPSLWSVTGFPSKC